MKLTVQAANALLRMSVADRVNAVIFRIKTERPS